MAGVRPMASAGWQAAVCSQQLQIRRQADVRRGCLLAQRLRRCWRLRGGAGRWRCKRLAAAAALRLRQIRSDASPVGCIVRIGRGIKWRFPVRPLLLHTERGTNDSLLQVQVSLPQVLPLPLDLCIARESPDNHRDDRDREDELRRYHDTVPYVSHAR